MGLYSLCKPRITKPKLKYKRGLTPLEMIMIVTDNTPTELDDRKEIYKRLKEAMAKP